MKFIVLCCAGLCLPLVSHAGYGYRPLSGRPSSAASAPFGITSAYLSGPDAALEGQPSSLAFLPGTRLDLQYGRVTDVQQSSLGLILGRGSWGLGLSLDGVDFGQFIQTDSLGTRNGSFGAYGVGLAMSLGWGFGNAAAGLTLRESTDLNNSSSYSPGGYYGSSGAYTVSSSLDFSAEWRGKKIYAGIQTLDINLYGPANFEYQPIPVAWDTRTLVTLGLQPFGTQLVKFKPAISQELAAGFLRSTEVGLEATLNKIAILRAGYRRRTGDYEGTEWKLGLGLNLGSWQLDYAFEPFLAGTQRHRAGISKQWGLKPRAPRPTPTPDDGLAHSPTPTPTPRYSRYDQPWLSPEKTVTDTPTATVTATMSATATPSPMVTPSAGVTP